MSKKAFAAFINYLEKDESNEKMKTVMEKYNIIDFVNDPYIKRLVKIATLCDGVSVVNNGEDEYHNYCLGYFKKKEDCDIFKAIVAKLFFGSIYGSILRDDSERIENKDISIEEYPFFALTYA